MCRQITTHWVFLAGTHALNHVPESTCTRGRNATVTWHTSERILLQHVSREALAPERAGRVDASVVADVALINQALVHVVPLNRVLHRISAVLLLANGEGLSGERTVRYCGAQRDPLLMAASVVWFPVGAVARPTFLQRRAGGEGWPLSDGGVPLVAGALLSFAATQKDMSAVEAQVAVGFAAAALAVQLQPQEAAVAALLKGKQRVLARFFYLWTFSCHHQTFPSAFTV